jgi:hypothetical protein
MTHPTNERRRDWRQTVMLLGLLALTVSPGWKRGVGSDAILLVLLPAAMIAGVAQQALP